MQSKMGKSKLLKCKCGYEWETNSKMEWATCPSCRLKVKNIVKDKHEKNESCVKN